MHKLPKQMYRRQILSYCLWSSYCLRQYEDQRQYERLRSLAKAPTIWRNKKTFGATRVSVPLLKFCQKLLPTQNFTEIVKSVTELWSKTIFNMAAVRHFGLNKFIFGHRVPNLLLFTKIQIHQNRYDNIASFVTSWAILACVKGCRVE